MNKTNQYHIIPITIMFILMGLIFSCDDDDDDTESGISFLNTYGSNLYDVGAQITQLSGRDYLLVGTSGNLSHNNYDVRLMKIDEYGHELWSHIFGLDWMLDWGIQVHSADNGEMFVLGHRQKNNSRDNFLTKRDSQGNEIWFVTYPHNVRFTDFSRTTDGGFIICGYSMPERGRCYLLKVDQDGVQQWTHYYDAGYDDEVTYSVLQMDDGGYVLCGYTESIGAGEADIYLIRTDESGNKLWSRTYGGSEWDDGLSMIRATDGGLVICGSTASEGNGILDGYLVKIDQQGNPEWSRSFGGPEMDVLYSVSQTQDGGFIMTGYTESFSAGSMDVYLVRTDSVGNELWSRTYGGANLDLAQSVRETADGGFILCGSTLSYGAGWYDILVIKTDATGEIVE